MTDRRTTIGINFYEGRAHVSVSTCIHIVRVPAAAPRASISQYGSTDYTEVVGRGRSYKAQYTRRGARDIALSMIIRHVNSIIRSTSVASCDLSREIHPRGRSTTFTGSRRHIRLEFCGLRGNRDERSHGKVPFP